jgi:hypothetical protein
MSDSCVFCGRTPVTREHLWPDWLRREAGLREGFEFRIEQDADGVQTRDITFTTPPFTQVARAVCANCNGGWMSEIEAKRSRSCRISSTPTAGRLIPTINASSHPGRS